MEICAAQYPDRDLSCILPRSSGAGHAQHLAMFYVPGSSQPEQVVWDNPDYRSPAELRAQAHDVKVLIERHAYEIRKGIQLLPAGQPPKAMKAGQRKRTRLGQVANLLANNVGVWIDGHRLETQEVGGSSGLRRVRELRDDYGWVIDQRPVPNSTDQYRLVELPDEPKD